MKHDVEWKTAFIGTCRACGLTFDTRRADSRIVLAARLCSEKKEAK